MFYLLRLTNLHKSNKILLRELQRRDTRNGKKSSLRCSAEEIPNTKGGTKGPENRQNPFATLALIKKQHIA